MTSVGVLTTSYPRWRGDFAGSFVEDAVRALGAAGHQVEVVAAGDGPVDQVEAELAGYGRDEVGVRVRRIGRPRLPSGASRLFYGPGAPEALEQGGPAAWLQAGAFWAGLCQEIRASAHRWSRIEAHWLLPCGLAARVVAAQLPLTIHAHSGDVALLERLPGGVAIARYLVGGRGADAPEILFASRNLRQRFARLAGGMVGHLARREAAPWVRGAAGDASAPSETGGDPTSRRARAARQVARHAVGLSGDGRTVLSVGRLVPIKGFDVLVRAFAVASSRARSAPATAGAPAAQPTLVIVGDGPERSRLEELARRLDVDLRLPGFVPRDEVATWMAGADLYVQPSRPLPSGRTEGLPVATLEALAAGLPVLASATGGLAELPYGPPRVRLVPPGDAAALAACLER